MKTIGIKSIDLSSNRILKHIFHYSNISLISSVFKASVLLLNNLLIGIFARPNRYHVRVKHWWNL